MDKYKRLMIALTVIIVISIVLYFILLFTGSIETKFPFGVLIPSWFVIFIPIINEKRLKEQKNIEKSQKRLRGLY
jgi:hypothetical protein